MSEDVDILARMRSRVAPAQANDCEETVMHLIRQMGHIAMATPDPRGTADDLVDLIGLKITESRGGTICLSSNERHHEVMLIQGAEPGIVAVGLEAMDAAAVDEITHRVRSEGFEILDDRPLGPAIDRAVRFKITNDFVFEVHTPVARDQAQRHIGPGARPRRIDHVNFKANNVLEVGDVFTKLFGMKLSDRTAGDEFNWFRCQDGYHHTLAVFGGEPSVHHYGFAFHSLQDFSGIADGLVLKERALLWGPGRHGAGGNLFQYYVDPNNCVVEMSVDMDHIANDELYRPRTWTITPTLADRWINLWGSPPPFNFTDPGLPFVPKPDTVQSDDPPSKAAMGTERPATT